MKKLLKKIVLVLMAVAVPALADGFTKANALLLKIQTGLAGLSIITVTLAALWVGYKVLFDGQSLRDCKGVIIGAIIIASASEIARMMV